MQRVCVNPATFPKSIYKKWLNASEVCHNIYHEVAGLERDLFRRRFRGTSVSTPRDNPSIEKVRDRIAEKREELKLADAEAARARTVYEEALASSLAV
tara:strand:+ start:352 stop:645 length:294 start_codon:yes stop_codon:yes gene_type:complete